MLEGFDLNSIIGIVKDFLKTLLVLTGEQVAKILTNVFNYQVDTPIGIVVVCLISAYIVQSKYNNLLLTTAIAILFYIIGTGGVVI